MKRERQKELIKNWFLKTSYEEYLLGAPSFLDGEKALKHHESGLKLEYGDNFGEILSITIKPYYCFVFSKDGEITDHFKNIYRNVIKEDQRDEEEEIRVIKKVLGL